MRALSHPVRLALIEALTVHGALTATQAGQLIEESPTTCSFHLRQLAKFGFVEEAGRGPGRARPWRVTRLGWTLDSPAEDMEANAAGEALAGITLQRQLERHHQFSRRRSDYPADWQRTGGESHTVWWVTPNEAAELQREIDDLVNRFRDRLEDPALRPGGSSPVEVVVLSHLFLAPDPVTQTSEAGAD
ncbi:winged helix-turn-helix domain-containing protein [Streptomyces sp. NPDC056519]|uniref:winged helix-turn-helix domain-containing protein n=1 Tax=Streptomyces sp. NPDC056519 TaxID=3345849 RepID=UPI00368FFFE9